ncbi:MAG: hypothetical protein AB7E52_07705 [Bdellovibrionales bacterium]
MAIRRSIGNGVWAGFYAAAAFCTVNVAASSGKGIVHNLYEAAFNLEPSSLTADWRHSLLILGASVVSLGFSCLAGKRIGAVSGRFNKSLAVSAAAFTLAPCIYGIHVGMNALLPRLERTNLGQKVHEFFSVQQKTPENLIAMPTGDRLYVRASSLNGPRLQFV